VKDSILVVDDEKDLLDGLQRTIALEMDCRVLAAGSAGEALALLNREPIDVVLADIRMPGMDGMALAREIQQRDALITVVLMTAFGTIEQAVEAIKDGAYDFIRKPYDTQDLVRLLRKALERNRLLRENVRLQAAVTRSGPLHKMIGSGMKMRQVFASIQMLARSDVTVLLLGESGTGKEMAARAIHALSQRRDRDLVVVNCPALPENILESELFGYRQGAFTNAAQDKKGLFEEAIGSTILLDEIGDLSMGLQTKLLRVLQEKEIKPLGSTRTRRVDVRIIASTNRDLAARLREGTFREDLYYRLNVATLTLPPLRERREDLPLLIEHFLAKAADELGVPPKILRPAARERLMRRQWAGNIRELENVIRGLTALAPQNEIGSEHLPGEEPLPAVCRGEVDLSRPYKALKDEVLAQFTTTYVVKLLEQTRGNVSLAAQISGIQRQSLQKIFKRYNISPDTFRPRA
jgi:DNA-binding NtrC family response regulator